MPNCIIYYRFSTEKQERGDSIERQLSDCTQFAEAQGWTVIETIGDHGRSAYKGEQISKGNLGKLEQRIRAGEYPHGTILLVERLDRLSRELPRKTQRWMEDITDHGMKIVVANGGRVFDSETLQDGNSLIVIMDLLMNAMVAHHESKQKATRVRSAWRAKHEAAKSGEVLTKGCPGWLRPVALGAGDQGTSFKIIDERARVIRRCFEWSAAGDGLERIVNRLNAEGVKPWGRQGGGISMTHVKRWIEGPSAEGDFIPYYASRTQPNGDRVVGYYPRIVDADLVARARAGIISRRGTGGRRYVNPYGNLFMGAMRCAGCNGNVVMVRGINSGTSDKKSPGYMRCSNAALGRGCGDRSLYRLADFEAAALQEMLHLALDDRFFQRADESLAATVALADADKAVADLEEQLTNVTNSMALVKDATPLVALYDGINEALLTAGKQRTAAVDALRVAKGATSGPEHMKRVLSVQNALQSDEPAMKLEARQRVHEAIKAVVQMVVCDSKDTYRGKPEKTLTMILVGGAVAIKFSNRGEVLARVGVVDQLNDPQMREGVLSGAGQTAPQLDDLARRAGSLSRS